MISAKRDSDFAGYMPFKQGSTIFDKASISWSCGVAHLTSDCSARTRELKSTKITNECKSYIKDKANNKMTALQINFHRVLQYAHLSSGFRPVKSSSITTPKL